MRPQGILYLGGMFALLLGERLIGGDDPKRWALSGAGLLMVLGALALGARAMAAATPDQRPAHRTGLVAALVGAASLLVYALQTDAALASLQLEEDAELRYTTAVRALFPLVWLAGTLPFLAVDRAIAASPVRVPVHRVRDAAMGALGAALGLSLLFPLNYLAAAHNQRWDFGYFKTARPSEGTRALVDNLEEPVRAVLFFPTSSEVTDELRTYFDELSGGQLGVEYVDHALEPELAKELKVRDNGNIALAKGDQVERIKIGADFDSAKRKLKKLDAEVQGGLLKLVKEERTLYFTVGHGEMYWKSDENKDRALNKLKTALKERNFTVKELGAAQGLGDAVPDDAAMVAILGPTDPFLPEELASLRAYTERGGRLLVGVEPGGPDLSALLDPVGVGVEPQGVLADDKFFLRVANGVQDRINLVTNKFSTHESVTTLSRNSRQAAVATPGATALVEKAPEGGAVKVRSTIRTLPSSWLDLDGDLEFDEPAEKRQTWSLAIASSGPAPASTDGREFRAVVLSDATWASDLFVPYSGNGVILFDALAWLVEDPSAGGEASNEEDVKIQHTREGQGLWFYGTAFVLPLGFFGLGMARVMMRRKRGEA
jgi:hypothetical protein